MLLVQMGGKTYVSTQPITSKSFEDIVAQESQNGQVNILTGTHGGVDGYFLDDPIIFIPQT